MTKRSVLVRCNDGSKLTLKIMKCPSCSNEVIPTVKLDSNHIPQKTCPLCDNTRLGKENDIPYQYKHYWDWRKEWSEA